MEVVCGGDGGTQLVLTEYERIETREVSKGKGLLEGAVRLSKEDST